MRTMYDSTTASDIPQDAEMVAGYINGRYAWEQREWDWFPNAQKIRIAVYIPGETPPDDGDVLDIEAPDAPKARDVAAQWVDSRNAAGVRPCIYTSASTAHFFTGLYCDFWLAEYTGTAHMCSVPGLNVVATQYAAPDYGSGGHYDLSVVSDDWHPKTTPYTPPPDPVVTDFGDVQMKRIDVRVQGDGPQGPVGLDSTGHGSTLVDSGHVINAYPNTAGYAEVPKFVGAQDDGGKDRVQWVGPPNFPPFDAHIWIAD